jgi:hypothetical protein
MKKQFKKSFKNRYKIVGEDLRILQQMITKRSVYAKARDDYRRPKHPKRYMEYIETY